MTLRRIAYVVNVFPKLSETFIASELAELRRRGVALCVLSLRRPGESLRHDFIAQAGLDELTSYDTDAFTETLRRFRPQLLHAHFATEPAAAARDLAAALKVPFTFTTHGYDIRRKAPPDFAARATAARAVVTVSQANARHILDTFGVPAQHLRVIPCGVDTDRFRPNGTPQDPGANPLVVCVARHAAVKNLDLLLDACSVLHRRGVAFRCVSVGDGPCRPGLEARRAQLGLREIVQFVGAADQSQVLAWWRRASIATLTSESEGMPVSLMEAAACGVPAVATAVGGVPEVIEQNVTGLLTPPGDAERLASAWQELIQNPARAQDMGKAARRRAEERFSLSRQVDSLLKLWDEVLR